MSKMMGLKRMITSDTAYKKTNFDSCSTSTPEMDKEFGLKQLVISDLEYKKTYNITGTSCTIGMDRRIFMNISRIKCELLFNPVIVIKLDETCDLEFDTMDIFKCIQLHIGGICIDELTGNQLKIYQAVKGYKIIKVGSKIFYPLPFDSFNKNEGILESKCKYYDIRLYIEFSSNPCVNDIKDFYLRTDSILTKTQPDYAKISKYYIDDAQNKDGYTSLIQYLNAENPNINTSQIVKIKYNQYFKPEKILSNISNIKIILSYVHLVEKIFIYFEDLTDNSIYKLKPFNKISLIADGYYIVEYNYDKLILDNDEGNIGYKLPKGVYQIDLGKFYSKNLSKVKNFLIELNETSMPNDNMVFYACANSINYLEYFDNRCSLIFAR